MKKVLCVVFSLVLCMTFLFTGCKDNTTPGGVVDNEAGNENVVNGNENNADNAVNNDNADNNDNAMDILSDNKIEEGETTVEDNLGKGVETFLSGSYYLEGLVYSEGEVMPVILATDGTNYQFTANYSGIAFGMLILDGSTYVVLPKTKQYTELSETLIKALDLEGGLGVNDFQAITEEGNSNDSAALSQYGVTINGVEGLCTVYTFEDSEFKLYSIGDDLIQVENFDKDGTMVMQIVVDELTSQIPADQLTLKGLENASVTSFIQSFIGMAV